MPITLVTSETR